VWERTGGPKGEKRHKGQVMVPGREGGRGLLEGQGVQCAVRVAEGPEEWRDQEPCPPSGDQGVRKPVQEGEHRVGEARNPRGL